MYIHVVLLELTPQADTEFFQQVEHYCDRVRRECAGVIAYTFRSNEADRAQGFSHATVCVFKDSAAHDAYQISDPHVAMKTYMSPFIKRLVVFDGDVAAEHAPE